MAIVKHIAVKNRFYSGAELYLCYEHDEKTGKPIEDINGRLVQRKNYLIEGINCNVETFGAECLETNNKYHKNKGIRDIKAHHYIISFAPDDDITMKEAMEFGKAFTNEFAMGHQALVAVHPDGHNGSGNMHIHISINSVRKLAGKQMEWHEKPCEYKVGCKHKCTNRMLRESKLWVMNRCREMNLNQVDLFRSNYRQNYWAKKRGEERDKDFVSDKDLIRFCIDESLENATSMRGFIAYIEKNFKLKVRETKNSISFKLEDSKRAIRGKSLGDGYTKQVLVEKLRHRSEQKRREKFLSMRAEKALEEKQRKEQEEQKRIEYVETVVTETPVETIIQVESQMAEEMQENDLSTKEGRYRELKKQRPNLSEAELVEIFDILEMIRDRTGTEYIVKEDRSDINRDLDVGRDNGCYESRGRGR